MKSGRTVLAMEKYRQALRLDPNRLVALNNLAWILATHPKADVRNGTEAVKLAQRACELTSYKEAGVVGTLDAAWAEAGQFDKAIETAQKTCELALAEDKKDLAATAKARLRLYQAGRPYHEASERVGE